MATPQLEVEEHLGVHPYPNPNFSLALIIFFLLSREGDNQGFCPEKSSSIGWIFFVWGNAKNG
jgi:hypothetical protein